TFYGSQSALYGIEGAVENVVEFLAEEGMVKDEDGILSPLPFGKRVSDLYIEPESAVILKKSLEKLDDSTDVLMILHAVASTPDVLGMYPKKSDRDRLNRIVMEHEDDFLIEIPEDGDYDYEYLLSDLKTAEVVREWIEETEEDTLLNIMGIGPGDIRARVDSMDWLTYAMIEIAVLFKPEVVKRLRRLLTRIRYGVREELIELVSLRGVGRARARTLYNNGIKSKKDIAEADFFAIANLPRIGNALAKSLKMQTDSFDGIPENPPEKPKSQTQEINVPEKKKVKGQSTLFDF
ncbi:MAG: ski2-type helicase, partial [Candidatus Methanomethylophilaceae archaeon]|nr:ski2-type helicase [Candidatus Methanomethylophilaceae archaeon]